MPSEYKTKFIPVEINVCVDDGEPMDADAQLSLCIYSAMGDTHTQLEDMTTLSETKNWSIDNLRLAATALLDIAASLESWKAGNYDQAHVAAQIAAWRNAEWSECPPVKPPEPVATDPATD